MRLECWESRLAAVIEAARGRPFRWGENDCFRLACASVHALTGVDHWPAFAGRYHTQRQALRILAASGSFEGFVSEVFGAELVAPRLARMGDLMLVPQGPRMPALAVCVGAHAAVPLEHELGFVARSVCSRAWRI